jgi:mevalonate kinase
MEKSEEHLTSMDDMTQTLQDQLDQTTETTEQQLQELMNLAHEWLTAYERIMGHSRKPAK